MDDNSEKRKKLDLPPTDETIDLTTRPIGFHPAGNVRYGGFRQYARVCTCSIWFLTCVLV